MVKAIINVRIYDYVNYVENGFVVFDKKIIKVGEMNDFIDEGFEIIDGKGMLLLPGQVCAHSHIYSTFARGLVIPFNPKNFQDILDQMWWKIDRQIDNKTSYYSGIAASVELMKNGVTTTIDHHASGKDIIGSLSSLKKALVDVAGMRAILAFETSDRYDVMKTIKENYDYFVSFHDSFTAGLFGLHASMSLSEETLNKVHDYLCGAPIHIHVAESEMDEEDCLKKYHKRIITRLDEHKLINENSLIVHGVFMDDSELDIIKERGAYVVVNTTSNMNNAVGIPNFRAYKEKGIKVMIGNDGLSNSMSTEYLNFLYTSHLREKTPNACNLGDVCQAIINAYQYANKILKIKIGEIKEDYEADFLLLPYSPFTTMDKSNALGHVFYGLFPNFKPQEVYINGVKKVSNYQIVDNDLKNEYLKANDVSKELWERIKKGE